MAFSSFDTTGNDDQFKILGKVRAMLKELYASVSAIVATSFQLDTGTKTASATAGAATLSKLAGVVTSESVTTAAAALYTLTLTNTKIAATDVLLASVANGTNSAGSPVIEKVTPGSGSATIVVRNSHASAAFNGTLKIAFAVIK